MTLGFRGEALPSIAAVAKVNLITRTDGEEFGTSLNIEGGEITDIFDAGCALGTTFIVRELFYNTPARMKFLKKDVSEGNYVSAAVEKIALANPQISVRFIRDGKTVFVTSGDGQLRNVCYSAFGKDFCDGLISVDSEMSGIRVHGLVTPPYNSRGPDTARFRTACAESSQAFRVPCVRMSVFHVRAPPPGRFHAQ